MEQQVLEVIRGLLQMPVWFVELELHKVKIMLNNGCELRYTANGHLVVICGDTKTRIYSEDERKILKILAKTGEVAKVESFLEMVLQANWKYVQLIKRFE